MEALDRYGYAAAVLLMAIGLYIVMSRGHLLKKLLGLNIFQTAVFLLYITAGKVSGGTPPILHEGPAPYSNPLPHVLILTAIVVGVATLALGLALAVRIQEAWGTVDEDEIRALEEGAEDRPEEQA